MPTDVVKKIGATNSPTTMDYSTLQAWEDACPANLVTADQRWIGECYDQGTFTSGVVISGQTTDATRYVILRCATGASFGDKAGVRTTALLYNTSNGVSVQASGGSGAIVWAAASYTLVQGLQIKTTSYALAARESASSTNVRFERCIITSSGAAGNIAKDSSTSTTWANCLFQYGFNAGNATQIHGKVYNCTFVNTASAGTSTAVETEYNQIVVKNSAIFGFSDCFTGTPAAGSDYNATDLSTATTGTHNQVSLTFSAQFVNSTNDFRAAAQTAGTGLHNGTPDSTNAAADISAFTRDATTPYIGAWEAAAPSQSFTASPSDVPEEHNGNIVLTLTGTSTTWAGGGSEFSVSGVSGTTKVSESVSSATAATLTIETASSATGTLTITDGDSVTTTVTVSTATLAVSPTTALVSDTTGLTLTGTHTLWSSETAAGLFSVSGVSGCSIGTPTVNSNTSATATLTTGASTGTLTITDNSTGSTTTLSVNAVSGSITVTNPTRYKTLQRNGSNQASITIAGTYTGGPATKTIEASFNGGSYATIATGSGGTFSGTLSSQAAGQGTLTVRFVNATGISTTVLDVGIGDVFVIAGQSNAVGLLNALQSYSHATLKATCFDYFDAAWQAGNDPFYSTSILGSPWPLLATLHMADQGVPCAFVQTAFGGRSLAAGNPHPWFFTKYRPDTGAAGEGTGGSQGYSIIQTSGVAASGVNSVKAVLWYQGENDIDGSVNRGSYAAALITLADNLAADLAGAPKVVPMQLGYYNGSGTPNDVRLANADAVALGANFLGMPTNYDFTNDLHVQTDPEGQAVAYRFWAVLKAELFGGTSGDGHGPRVTAVQHNSARTSVTVGFDKVLKTGLTFSTAAWAVTGNGSAATVSAVAYHGTDTRAVVLTLSGAATLPILVSFGLGNGTAGLVVPRGPNLTMPDSVVINLPAEPFKDKQAALEGASAGGGSGGLLGFSAGMTGGMGRQ